MSTVYLWKKRRVARAPSSGVDVVGFKRQMSGVLRGQILRCYIANYPTKEAALAAHPDAAGWDGGEPVTFVNHLPGEDDTVPGGRWPDDIGGRNYP